MKRALYIVQCLARLEISVRSGAGLNQDLSPTNYKENGFTLLEVVVALSIIAIVMLAVYRLHTQTLSAHATIQFQSVAPLLAQKTMTQALIDRDPGRQSQSGQFETPYDGFSYTVETASWDGPLQDSFGNGRLQRITVVVSASDASETYTLTTYRLNQAGEQ